MGFEGGEGKQELSGKSTGALLEALRHLREEKFKIEEREAAANVEAARLRDRQNQLEEQLAKIKVRVCCFPNLSPGQGMFL